MPDIRKIKEGEHNSEEGFIVVWEMVGFNEATASGRAVLMTAMRFPSTITKAETVNITEFGDRDFNVEVFVPTEGFPSAGINNPVEWLRDQFDSSMLNLR